MRLLKTLFVLAIATCAVMGASPLHAQTPACEKDVFVYFDVSGSMRAEHDGVSTLQLFTSAVQGLLNRENFVEPRDHVSILTFAERVAPLNVQGDRRSGATALSRLQAPTAAQAGGEQAPPDVGNTNRTNITSVLDDVAMRIDPSRHQIFIVASDFADDPDASPCGMIERRVMAMRATAEEQSGSIRASALTRLILLTSPVRGEQCAGAHQEVADAVRSMLVDILDARQVAVTRRDNFIAGLLRRAAAEPITLQPGFTATGAEGITVRVTNSNPFPVSIQALTLSSSGIPEEIVPQNRTARCGEPLDLPAKPSQSLLAAPTITVSADVKDMPPGPPLELPSRQVTLTTPEFQVFKNALTASYIIEGTIRSNVRHDVRLAIQGEPGTYEIPIGPDPTRFALALTRPGHPETPSTFRLSVDGGALNVEGRESGSTATGQAEVSHSEHSGGEVFLTAMQWSSALTIVGWILSAIGLFPRFPWLKLFENTHTRLHLAEAFTGWARRMGIFSAATMSILPYGRLPSATPENVMWAVLVFFFGIWVFRRVAIAVWPLLERRLRHTPDAKRIRRRCTFAVLSLAVLLGLTSYLLLSRAVPSTPITHSDKTVPPAPPVSPS